MSVVNVRGLHDLKEWMTDPNNIYIGRKGVIVTDGRKFPSQDSIWNNPFKLTREINRDESFILYRKHLDDILRNPDNISSLLSLHGKNLGCWCAEDMHHGHILREYINHYNLN